MVAYLLHSMEHFAPLIRDGLALAGARRICLIHSGPDALAAILADYCLAVNGSLIALDPLPFDHGREDAPDLSGIDAWVIDGDRNYHAVLGALRRANELSAAAGASLLCFVHHIDWPCARRDSYLARTLTPDRHRHPSDRHGGVLPDCPGLVEQGGLRAFDGAAWATREGGLANGVLTAIEDFIAEIRSKGGATGYAAIPGMFGLGILFDTDAPWAGALAELLMPWHQNPLLAALEMNRLHNFFAAMQARENPSDHP